MCLNVSSKMLYVRRATDVRASEAHRRVRESRSRAAIGLRRCEPPFACTYVWSSTHVLSVRGRTTRTWRVYSVYVISPRGNRFNRIWLSFQLLFRAPIQIHFSIRWRGIANTAGLRGRKYSVLAHNWAAGKHAQRERKARRRSRAL